MSPRLIGALAAVVVSVATGCAPAPSRAVDELGAGSHRDSVAFGGRLRTYVVYRPPTVPPRRPAPLVLVLHGAGGTGAGIAEDTGFDALADRHGFVVVYPDGVATTWNAGGCCLEAMAQGVDDVGFLERLVRRVEERTPIDRGRVFATGFSNGGMLAYRFACEEADRVAAVAVVAASMVSECSPSRPVSVLHLHGTADRLVDPAGWSGRLDNGQLLRYRPLAAVVDEWRRLDDCPAEAEVHEEEGVRSRSWGPCRDATAVVAVTLDGHGHSWPGNRRFPAAAGAASSRLDASEAIWAFFRDHGRSGR